ncbi:GntR family transcriptional regulator [Inediibacterium massiliense]|uniref:GntR family transcriptional regulator n=1 Tax=Inediibacterium massiliense TaxID=1658111 RepID=UPI0006B56842|nr:winged helix-turn-helix domain-containing protein [Inediibacterium massiliense]
MKIERKSGIPIYIQVKNHILEDIKNGVLKIGDKLPTERELSQILKVSRNTISTAYNLLEQEGILVSYQGRGTFVAQDIQICKCHHINHKVIENIDLALEEAMETGLNTKEFLSIVKDRVKEKEKLVKNIDVIFIECNIEQAKIFSDELSRITNTNVKPMTIPQLQERNEETETTIKDSQIIITTFNHINEVKDLIGDFQKEIFGVTINPNMETIVKIAKYPKGTKFALISLSKEFHFKVEYALRLAGLENLFIEATTSKDPKELQRIINQSDVIIVSPGRGKEMQQMVEVSKEVIRFDYVLDKGSVNAIISNIIKKRI